MWMHERPLDPAARRYLLKHTTQHGARRRSSASRCESISTTLTAAPADDARRSTTSARVTITCHRPLFFDAYAQNRATGAFILIDSLTNDTVAAGMILDSAATQPAEAEPATRRARTQVSPRERADKLGQAGLTLLLSGAATEQLRVVAFALERRLFDLGRVAHVLFAGEGSAAALAWAARACTDAGLVTICVDAGGGSDEVRARVGSERVRDGVVGDEPLDRAVERLVALVG